MQKEQLKKLLEEGKSTRQIAEITGKHHNTVSYWIQKHGLGDTMRFKKLDTFKFDKIDNKYKAYTLGFILADGAISEKKDVEISVAIADGEVVDFISGVINSNSRRQESFNKQKRIFPKARTVKRIKDITKFTGGELKKDRHYPRVKPELEQYLLQGLFDADGCITWGRRKKNNRLWYKISFTSSLNILTGVQKFLYKKLDISSHVRPKKGEDCFIIEFSKKSDIIKFLDFIYSDKELIILQRKYHKANALRLELEGIGGNSGLTE